jgi:hypothetical protein
VNHIARVIAEMISETLKDDASRRKYEARYTDPETGVVVAPVLVATD